MVLTMGMILWHYLHAKQTRYSEYKTSLLFAYSPPLGES